MSDSPITNNAQADQRQISPLSNDQQGFDRPWIRHYEAGVPHNLAIPDRSVTWLLDEAVRRFPGRTAFIYYGSHISYAQFSTFANRFATALLRLGITKGDRVAIALPNIPQYPIAYYGALRAGAVIVPTNPLYTEREILHQLADSGAKILVMLDNYYPVVVRNIRSQTDLEHIILANPSDFLPPLLRFLYPLSQRRDKQSPQPLPAAELKQDSTLHHMQSLLAPQSRGGVELFDLPAPATTNELAALQYTGGTTGFSRGAMLTHHNILANTVQVRSWVPRIRDGEEKVMCVLPFFHAYGMTACLNFSIYNGATMLLVPRFKAANVIKVLTRYHPRIFPGIPTLYMALLREAKKHPGALAGIECCISGAMALPAQVQEDFEALAGGKLVEGYGLSEASPVSHCNPLTDECRNGTIGLPLPDIDAAIMQLEGKEFLPPGEIGELVLRGPNIMSGYWQRDDENAQIFVNGWLRTGDIAKMDEDGFFSIVERSKEVIITGGFNVYPREVEEVLYTHPAVAEASTLGLPDGYRGEAVSAFVVLKPEREASDNLRQELLEHCRHNLTGYKVPRTLDFRKQLPKSLVGKIIRRKLREQVLAERAVNPSH